MDTDPCFGMYGYNKTRGQTIRPVADYDPSSEKGDANGDGTVNAADIVEVVNYIMNKPSWLFDASAADVNGDGVINAADIVEMVKIIMAG